MWLALVKSINKFVNYVSYSMNIPIGKKSITTEILMNYLNYFPYWMKVLIEIQ